MRCFYNGYETVYGYENLMKSKISILICFYFYHLKNLSFLNDSYVEGKNIAIKNGISWLDVKSC
jgi:hypothetical protein